MQVRIKKLHPNAVIPSYAKAGDAGLDLVATSSEFGDGNARIYGTGLSFEIPSGYVGLLFPRSSICKTSLSLSNSVGVLDSGYRGEVKFVFNATHDVYDHRGRYKIGDKIGQILIIPYPQIEFQEVDTLTETERGTGGYGSTGR